MRRALATVGLLVGLAALSLQFALSLPGSFAAGRSVAGAVEYFFSFFTVLTNTCVTLAYAAELTGRPAFFGRAHVRAGLAVAMTIVCIVYAEVLSSLWAPQGLLFVADTGLHYAAPALYLAWWLGFAREGTSRLSDVIVWLLYPLAYLAYALVRGTVVDQYPYPFLDLTVRTAGEVFVACVMLLALFIAISLAAVAIDRRPVARRTKNRTGDST